MEAVFIVLGIGLVYCLSPSRRRVRRRPFSKARRRRRPLRQRPATPAREIKWVLPPIPSSREIIGKAHVIDGDTIRIGKTKIRIAGIDAPEIDMPWGQKSKWAMVSICKGQVITAKLDGTRSYDRLVGTCFLPDGRDIGAEIVKQGLALDLPAFSAGKYRLFETDEGRRRLRGGMFGHRQLHKSSAQNEVKK